jgi:hypothetical protein
MIRTFAMIAVAGLVGSASAQTFSLSASATSVNPGDVVTITLSYEGSGANNAVLSGGIFNMPGTGPGAAAAGTWNFPGTFVIAGTAADASITGARYLQAPNTNNAQGALYSYNMTATGEGTIVVGLESINAVVGAFGSLGGTTIAGTVQWEGVSIEVVPTPASAAVLALGGLVATRRRR